MSDTDRVAAIFASDDTDAPIWVAHGYGIKIRTEHGHLVVSDGIGPHRRERRIPRVNRTLHRIVITGPDGFVTLDAIRWCGEHGITITTVNPDGEIAATYDPSSVRTDRASLIRAQALASLDGPLSHKAESVIDAILALKLQGQATNATKILDDPDTGAMIARRLDETLSGTDPTARLHRLEGWAAQLYFRSWTRRVGVPWDRESASRVPEHWHLFRSRVSPLSSSNSKQYATDPINAMLNYAYSIGYAEARTACIAHDLDPRLGFLHSDKKLSRDSLALDVLESIRPDIDAYILGLLGHSATPRVFSHHDFTEHAPGLPAGTVRVVAPLTHEIAEQSYFWYHAAEQTVETIIRILTGSGNLRGTHGRRRDPQNLLAAKAQFQSQDISHDDVMSDADWQTIKSAVPDRRIGKTGIRPIDDRVVIAAILYVTQHDRPWTHVPPSLGIAPRTLQHRRRDWQRDGVWDDIWSVILTVAADKRTADG
jgi:CRISPR-associated protein Cas1